MARPSSLAGVGILVLLSACARERVAFSGPVVSLFGEPLAARALNANASARITRELREAEADLAANPKDLDARIWVGRRQAYLGRYGDAIATFSRGLRIHGNDPRLLRHRGHRWITVRRFDAAVRDLTLAAELSEGKPDRIEPDGMPNALGIPTSTTQSNIYYHLGLAHFLLGDYQKAVDAYALGRGVCRTTDMTVATINWQALSLRRLGRIEPMRVALNQVGADAEVIENGAYLDLVRLQQGRVAPESLLQKIDMAEDITQQATLAFGVAAWLIDSGEADRGKALLRRILTSPQWAAFGYIAAEAELHRSS